MSTGPGLISSLWGIFLFKEVTGRRNFIILLSAGGVVLTGVTCIAIGKVGA